jgi:hemerythrin-like metal-binding protein
MPELIWDQSKSIGFEDIDAQHRKLFAIFNALTRAMETNQEWPAVEAAVGELVRYTATHFRDEERIMREYGYPGMDGHVQEHALFLEKVGGFRFSEMLRDPGLANEIFMFLADWIVEHTSTEDVVLGRFIQRKPAAT